MKLYKIAFATLAFLALAIVFGPTIVSSEPHQLIIEDVTEDLGDLVGIGMREGVSGFARNDTRKPQNVYVCRHNFTDRFQRRERACPCPSWDIQYLGKLEPGERRAFSILWPERLGSRSFAVACTD